ncbi:uncharacterized protein LOC108204079 [Daucus carota subsp. sativus]|uniref:uncharacterized protein LOC108204079 n=1 Tax=Daucus carota subsp. sativus TaxID=79200 RepID=UPI00308357E8
MNPVAASLWLKEMEKAFTLTQVSDELKTEYASYFLKNEANYWWESTRALEGEGLVEWTRFTELFLNKYFPSSLANQMEIEFLELKQGEKSVTEYENKFTELARLVPVYVSTESQKAKRFQQGLKPEIRSGVVALQLTTYTSVVLAALVIESDQKLAAKEKGDTKRKFDNVEDKSGSGGPSQRFQGSIERNRNQGFRRQNFPPARPSTTSVGSDQSRFVRTPIANCKRCGKRHGGLCKMNVDCFRCGQKGHYSTICRVQNPGITCHKCGKVGHLANNCRSNIQTSVGGSSSQGPVNSTARARTFKMTKKSTPQDSDVVAGTLSLNFVPVKVLFDSGAIQVIYI